MAVASKKNVLAYVLALTLVIGALFTLRHRISFFNSSSVTIPLAQLTEAQSAVQKYFDSAKEGDVLAMNALGLMYAQGQIGKIDGKVNYDQAFHFLKKAADKGNGDAQNSIGSLYASGVYGKIADKADLESALEYFQLAAAQNHLEGLNNLASLYRSGAVGSIENKPNYTKVVELYNRQVELKDSRGLVSLATMYATGESVEKNVPRAVELLNTAIKENNPAASRLMGELHFAGIINKDADYDKAASYYKDAVAGGDSGAMVSLGSLYMSGKFGKNENRPNFEAALDLYRKAAQNNNPAGITNIGAMYYAGILAEEGRTGEEVAKQLWTQAASMGDAGAKNNLEVLRKKSEQLASAEGATDEHAAKPEAAESTPVPAPAPAVAPVPTEPAPTPDHSSETMPESTPMPAPAPAPVPTEDQHKDKEKTASTTKSTRNSKIEKFSKLGKSNSKKVVAKADSKSEKR